MDTARLTKSVRRITVLKREASGATVPVTVYQKRRKKKKGSKLFKPAERLTRRIMQAQEKAADRYVSRHNKSNRKKKDGWIRDFAVNSARASNRGMKALKLRRMFS